MQKIRCPLKCDIPDDVILVEVLAPRHNWSDVAICPNTDKGCDKAFLVVEKGELVTKKE